MVLDLDVIWKKLQQMPAVFVSGLQYNRERGLIDDYFNCLNNIVVLYEFAVQKNPRVPQYAPVHFVGHLLGEETYHDYLERRLDQYNGWLARDPDKVQKHLEHWLPQSYVERGCSTEIRSVTYQEFMDALYHEKAKELNRVVRDLKRYLAEEVVGKVPFEEMDHRRVLEAVRQIGEFKDINLSVDDYLDLLGLNKR